MHILRKVIWYPFIVYTIITIFYNVNLMTSHRCGWPNVSDSSFGAISFNTFAATSLLLAALITRHYTDNPPTTASICNEWYRAAWWLICWDWVVTQYALRTYQSIDDCLYTPVMYQYWMLMVVVGIYGVSAGYYIYHNDRE